MDRFRILEHSSTPKIVMRICVIGRGTVYIDNHRIHFDHDRCNVKVYEQGYFLLIRFTDLEDNDCISALSLDIHPVSYISDIEASEQATCIINSSRLIRGPLLKFTAYRDASIQFNDDAMFERVSIDCSTGSIMRTNNTTIMAESAFIRCYDSEVNMRLFSSGALGGYRNEGAVLILPGLVQRVFNRIWNALTSR